MRTRRVVDLGQFASLAGGGRTRPRRPRRVAPAIENLEGRALLAPVVTIQAPLPRVYPLMQSVTFKVNVAGGAATAFQVQTKKATAATWTTVTNTQTDTEIERLAGYYQVRGEATVNGKMIFSLPYTFEVRFPTYSEITSNPGVIAATDLLWAATRVFASDNSGAQAPNGSFPNSKREEMGFWIQLDTATGKYTHTATVNGPVVGPGVGASIDLGPRPADTLAPGGKSAVYVVASFHTHTPTTYRTVGRRVGPSAADNTVDTNDDVTGVVYDYIASPAGGTTIPAGYNLNGAAMLYQSGPSRRSTPRT